MNRSDDFVFDPTKITPEYIRKSDTYFLFFYTQKLFNFLDALAGCGLMANEHEQHFQYFFIQIDTRMKQLLSKRQEEYFKDVKLEYDRINLFQIVKDVGDFFDAWELGLRATVSGFVLDVKSLAAEQGVLNWDFMDKIEEIIKLFQEGDGLEDVKKSYENTARAFKQMDEFIAACRKISEKELGPVAIEYTEGKNLCFGNKRISRLTPTEITLCNTLFSKEMGYNFELSQVELALSRPLSSLRSSNRESFRKLIDRFNNKIEKAFGIRKWLSLGTEFIRRSR